MNKNFENYRCKQQSIKAEKLESDITYTSRGASKEPQEFYLEAGNYLIKGPGERIYPANRDLFEFLFEREETNEEKID